MMNDYNKNKEDINEQWEKERDSLTEEYKDKDIDLGFDEPIKPKEELPPPSPERVDSIPKQAKNLYSGFDLESISHRDYIFDIFDPKYDNYKSLEYLKAVKKEKLEQGYLEGPLLDSFLFWSTMLRRLQIKYQEMHVAYVSNKKDGLTSGISEDLSLLEEIQKVTTKVQDLQKLLDAQKDKQKEVGDIVDLHTKTLQQAEQYLKEHYGEYVTLDGEGNIVTTDGKAHWAFVKELNEKSETQYFVWSEELIYLFRKEIIPIEVVCFALRTSPEGIKWVADKRGEELPKFDMHIAEQKLRKYMLDFEEIQHGKQIKE
jgi:hypothetical protein